MNERGFTERMVSALEKLQDEFVNIYCKEDFDVKLNNLRRAKNTSGWPSRLNELYALLDDCGINYEQNRETEYYERLVNEEKIPSFEDLAGIMVSALFEKFLVYPRPEEYMERMIDRLGSDDWSNDTVRVRILKQFVKYGNCLTYQSEDNAGNKTETVKIYGGETYLKKYLKEKLKKKVERVADELDAICDDIFDVLDSATKEQKKPTGTYGILKMVDDLACGKFRVGGATKKSLYLFAMVYGMSYEEVNTDDALSSLPDIEKDLFRDYYTNNLMRYMHAFYRENYKAFENPSGRGVNYKNFAEVIYLYYLANDYTAEEKIKRSNEMILRVQEMQRGKGNRVSANVMGGTRRYIDMVNGQDEAFFGLSEDELAEYICNNYNCSRQKTEKGKNTTLVVGELQVEDEQETAYSVYKDVIEELLDTLAENECWSREEIKEHIKEMEEKPEFKGKRISQRDVSREYLLPTCNYGLWFTDISADFKSGLTGISDRIIAASRKTGIEVSTDNMVPFVETLKGMQRFMGKEVKEEEKKGTDRQEHTNLKMAKTDALYVDSSSSVTRTKLLTAFYYLFNARYADDFGECGMSFREVFDMFSEEVRPYLEDAYYPDIDPKNIFDVLLIFSSYSYLNMG